MPEVNTYQEQQQQVQQYEQQAQAPNYNQQVNSQGYAGPPNQYYEQPQIARQPQNFGGMAYGHPNQRAVNVQPAAFSSFETPHLNEVEAKNLDMLLDIQLQVTVELGRTKRSIKEILELSQGSIVELDKLAGEPVDILINSKLVAKGEVVVIDENFGVRVTDIISQTDRLKNLQS